jgi:PAS domain S-box-containing protein
MAPSTTELILDRAHNGVVSMDERGVVTYWNPSAERMFGLGRENAIGRTVAELIIPERFREIHTRALARFLEEGGGNMLDRRVELSALRADGSEFPVELTISALRERGGWTFHAFIQDISLRREGEREREQLVEELRRALDRSQMRFEAIVGALSDPVTIRDRDDHLVYANRAALEQLGVGSLQELERTRPDQIMADYLVSREDGSQVRMEDIPSVRILRGEPAEPLLIRAVNRHTGRQRWNLLKAAPLADEDGSVTSTITIIEDVTEQKQAEHQARFLARASVVLASSLDYEQTLRNVAELAVPEIADWCAVDLFEPGGRRQLAVAHVDPGRLRLAEQLRRYESERPDPDRGVGLVLRTGERLLYPEISQEMVEAAAIDARHLELLQAMRMRSVAIVPMRIGERILGAMTLVSAESARALDQFELESIEQVATRAAVAIENARLYAERSEIAHTLQQSLLPDELPEIPEYELAAAYVPAVESSAVGGDFYDVWKLDDAWMVVIGDVTGKGVQAAALTSLVRYTLRAAAEYETSPAALLAQVDRTLKKQRPGSICTALCLRLEEHAAVCSVGGHPLPILMDEHGVETVGARGPLLGGFEDGHWEDEPIEIATGAVLFIYTDGVTDALAEDGSRFGIERLHETLSQCGDCPAGEVVQRLLASLNSFQGASYADDTAALVLRRGPKGLSGSQMAGDSALAVDFTSG